MDSNALLDGETPSERRPRLRQRLTMLIVAIAASVGCIALWAAAARFQSPAQVEAAADPPALEPVVAVVERTSLSDVFTVTADLTQEFRTEAAAPGEGVVTAVNATVADGEAVSGTWVMAVNDRPVFFLEGPHPLFRDLVFGVRGNDVKMVQAALRTVGLVIPEAETGTVGPATQQAFAELYKRSGYPPQDPPPEAAEQRAAARAALEEAKQAEPPEEEAVRAAEVRLWAAEAAAGPSLPASSALVAPYQSVSVHARVDVGERVAGDVTLAELRSGGLVWVASVPAAVAATLSPGTPCEVTAGAEPVATTIVAVGDEPGQGIGETEDVNENETADPAAGEATGEGDVELRIAVPKGIRPEPVEALVRVDRSTVSGEHLIVPATAVVDRGSRSYVAVRDEEGWRELAVTVLGQLAGRVAVDSDQLQEGAEVRVGHW